MDRRQAIPYVLVVAVIAAGLVIAPMALLSTIVPPTGLQATAAFTFGTAGDYAFDSDTIAVWDSMKTHSLSFALTLGDHSYGQTTEANWCSNFKARVPNVLITAGNHDTGESSGDQIADLVAACPYPFASGLNGNYGREYYVDLPIGAPIARITVTGCGTTFTLDGTGRWACSVGDSHYNFVRNAIDGARSSGIRWTVVAMHKLCISTSDKTCEIGQDFMDLLHFKKVDLVLQAHSHSYQRSQSLACAVRTLYVPECVRNPGNATLTAVVGTGGQTGDSINTGDSENGYFAAWSGTNTAGWGHGWLKVAVATDGITGTFVNARSSFTETFSIGAGVAPPPPPTPQCSDGLDNDGDGLIDFPADPGCTSATDNDETNAPPPPPSGLVPTKDVLVYDSPDPSTVGQTVTFRGYMMNATNNKRLPGVTVSLEVRLVGTTTWMRVASQLTNTNGDYYITYAFTSSGSYETRTVFDGNSVYAGSTSTIFAHTVS